MLRKEQFAFGAGLTASALAVILRSEVLAWAALIIGIGLIADIYIRDLLWGRDRPTSEQIQKMSAEEYKETVLKHPKTERWVNWLKSGYHALKTQMRKLAREAVIFMLLTPPLLFGGVFGVSYHNTHKGHSSAKSVRSDVPAGMTNQPLPDGWVPNWTPIPCYKGEAYIETNRVIWTCQNGTRIFAADEPKTILELIDVTWPFAFYGIPIGFGLWLLYRTLRFAIKG